MYFTVSFKYMKMVIHNQKINYTMKHGLELASAYKPAARKELLYAFCCILSFPLGFSTLPKSYQTQHIGEHTIFLQVTTV